MRLTMAGLVVLASVGLAGRSLAIPPTFCHETLTGVLFSSVSGAFTSPVRLSTSVRNDEGDLSLRGRFHCKRDAKHPQRCTGTGTDAGIDSVTTSFTGFGLEYDIRLIDLQQTGFTVRCELETEPAFLPEPGCFGGLIGSYTCRDGETVTDHGRFTLVATCGQCRP